MRSFENWMDEYALSHQHPTNQIIHKICVPLIMFSVIGLIWMIPFPAFFPTASYLNWATLFVLGCLVFYLSLNFVKQADATKKGPTHLMSVQAV